MAIPIANDDVLQVTVEGTNERFGWAWVTHWKVSGVIDPAAHLVALAVFLKGFFGTLKANLTDQWQAECIKIGRVSPNPMGTFFYNADFPIVGTVATDGIPNQSAAVIRMNTDEVGPSNRGRWFLSGLPEASTDGGQILTTPLGDLQTDVDALLTGYSTGGESGTLVVFSRTLYGTDPPGHPAAVADYTSVVTAIPVQANLGVIRHRRYPRNSPA